MCGIWASIELNVEPTCIDEIAHRGPDGSGWRAFGQEVDKIFLGARRLAVIDTSSAGEQPLGLWDRDFWIVYNGEVYNHAEVRADLTSAGHRFKGQSDTEVVLRAYAEWGKSSLRRLRGMFAFAVWDGEKRQLFVARDRFGIKPLYFLRHGGGIAFASELKQFRHVPDFTMRLFPEAVVDFLTEGLSEHRPETLIAEISQLMPGHCLTIEADDPTNLGRIERWYSPAPTTSTGDPARRVRELLDQAVAEHLVSDVGVGSCLSGGLDSSSIVCLAGQRLPGLRTVTACYPGEPVDERAYAEVVAKHAGVNAYFTTPDPVLLANDIERIHGALDGPVSSTSVLAQWAVFAAAKRAGNTVMLDGQGADEQLGGYRDSVAARYAGLIRQGRLISVVAGLGMPPAGVSAGRLLAMSLISALPEAGRQAVRRSRGLERPVWLHPDYAKGYAAPLPKRNSLRAFNDDQFCRTSLPALLRYEDRSSMAHGVEARVPFLDHRLVECLAGLDERDLIGDGETKLVLRSAMRGTVPDMVLSRRDKIGFATPEQKWLAGPMRNVVNSLLDHALREMTAVFEPTGFAVAGRSADRWRVASLAAWMKAGGVRV